MLDNKKKLKTVPLVWIDYLKVRSTSAAGYHLNVNTRGNRYDYLLEFAQLCLIVLFRM